MQWFRSRNGQLSAQDIGLLHTWLCKVRARVKSQGGNPWGKRGRRMNGSMFASRGLNPRNIRGFMLSFTTEKSRGVSNRQWE